MIKRLALALLLGTSPAMAGDSVPLIACAPGSSMTTSFDERGWYCEKSPVAITAQPSLANDTVAIVVVGPYLTIAEMTAFACSRARDEITAFYERHQNTTVLCIPRSGQ